MCVSFGVWSMSEPQGTGIAIIYFNFFLTYCAVYALRGIYFALLEESSTPTYLTGAAVGMISLVGYTPEIFFAPIGNRIIDANPGVVGFQNYFWFLAASFSDRHHHRAGLACGCTAGGQRRYGQVKVSRRNKVVCAHGVS